MAVKGMMGEIDHVKYWKMNQHPYVEGDPRSCECFWNYSHHVDGTLIPVPGAIPGGPPSQVRGPSLGGGVIRV